VHGNSRRDGDGENLGEQERADHSADGADTVDGSLELALRSRVDPARHQRLHGGAGDAPKSEEWDGAEKHPAARRKGKTQEAKRPEGQAGQYAAAFAEATNEGTDKDSGDNASADADHSEGEADIAFCPGVAILGIEDKDSR